MFNSKGVSQWSRLRPFSQSIIFPWFTLLHCMSEYNTNHKNSMQLVVIIIPMLWSCKLLVNLGIWILRILADELCSHRRIFVCIVTTSCIHKYTFLKEPEDHFCCTVVEWRWAWTVCRVIAEEWTPVLRLLGLFDWRHETCVGLRVPSLRTVLAVRLLRAGSGHDVYG